MMLIRGTFNKVTVTISFEHTLYIAIAHWLVCRRHEFSLVKSWPTISLWSRVATRSVIVNSLLPPITWRLSLLSSFSLLLSAKPNYGQPLLNTVVKLVNICGRLRYDKYPYLFTTIDHSHFVLLISKFQIICRCRPKLVNFVGHRAHSVCRSSIVRFVLVLSLSSLTSRKQIK